MQTLQMSGRRRRAALGLAMVALAMLAPVAALAAPFAAVVMDARSGEILHARNHYTRLHPASLTKMMTLYIAFEAIRNGEITLDTTVRVSANAAGTPCSCLGLRAGQTIALRYLIRAAAVRSTNDAATAIGEAIAGSEAAFIERMNRTARALGMTNTSFRNAHGLTAPGHLSSARDMTILGRQLFFDYPEYWNLWSRRSADAGITQVVSTNRGFLDGYAGADGIKTGFTRAAGFNLTASAERDGRRIIVTVFGGQSVPDRTRRVTELMDLGFARAPARVALRRPPPPNYGAQPPGSMAMAQAVGPDRPEPGRTVRINTAVARSPVPPLRPVAAAAADPDTPGGEALPSETAIAAIEEGIEAALNAVADAAVDAAAAGTAGPAHTADESAPPVRPFALAGAATPEPAAADLPFGLVEADDAPDAPPLALADAPAGTDPEGEDAAGADATSVLAVASAPMPPLRPDTLGPEESDALAEAAAEPASDLPAPADATAAGPTLAELRPLDATETRSGGADDTAGTPAAAEAAPPVRLAALVAPAIVSPGHAAPAPRSARPVDPEPLVVLTYTSPGDAAEASPRLASLTEAGRAEPARPPVVDRSGDEVILRQLSTSEPRLWGVSVGRFGTRDAAERALMRTALAELSAFDGALRRVQRQSGGFEATFVGLTEAQALVACDRLQARARDCAPLAP